MITVIYCLIFINWELICCLVSLNPSKSPVPVNTDDSPQEIPKTKYANEFLEDFLNDDNQVGDIKSFYLIKGIVMTNLLISLSYLDIIINYN